MEEEEGVVGVGGGACGGLGVSLSGGEEWRRVEEGRCRRGVGRRRKAGVRRGRRERRRTGKVRLGIVTRREGRLSEASESGLGWSKKRCLWLCVYVEMRARAQRKY